MRSTVLQVRGHKSPLLLGGKTLGLRCSADADRVMYNKYGCSVDSGQKLLMRCGQWTQIFCLYHLYTGLRIFWLRTPAKMYTKDSNGIRSEVFRSEDQG